MSAPACPCGERHPHRVARRTTADGATVAIWSDGWMTDRAGNRLGKLRARFAFDTASLWAFADLLGFFDLAELRPLIAEWKRARRLVGATDETARREVLRRMAPPRKAPAPNNDALYREIRLANGLSVDIRIR